MESPKTGRLGSITTGARELTLPVSEVFVSLQGEGPYAGRTVQFIRLGGCNLSCTWCLDPETPVLMADWSEKPLGEVAVGDLVMSHRNRRYEAARVEQTMTRHVEERVTVVTSEGEVTATPDHVFATAHQLDGRRRAPAAELEGRHVRMVRSKGWAPDDTVRTDDWWTGWAQGLILGDGHVSVGRYPKVWLRVCDRQLADAYSKFVNERGANTTVRVQTRRTNAGREVFSVAHSVNRVPEVVGLPSDPDEIAGFLAGFFDAEGHVGRNQISMTQKDDKTLDRVYGMVSSLGLPATVKYTDGDKVGSVTINGAANVDAFMRLTRPVLDRKRTGHRNADNRMLTAVAVNAVKEADPGPVVNLTTSTGFFIAGGMLVEQCDTAYTWDASRFDLRTEIPMTPVQDVVDQLIDGVPVVLSGGEPLMHQKNRAFRWMIADITLRRGLDLHVETNGTIEPDMQTRVLVHHFAVSPKLPHAGDHKHNQDPTPWDGWQDVHKSILKYVVRDETDVAAALAAAEALGMPRDRVWVMPEGVDNDTLLARWPAVARAAADHHINACQRLHVLAWGDTKGT